MTTATYRLQQGLRALFAFATPLDPRLPQRFLSPAEYAAFTQMSRPDQLHSLNVLRAILQQNSPTPKPLAIAALLHDVGKSRYHMTLCQKTLATLITRLLPKLAISLAREQSLTPLRAPFTISRSHPQWSARIMRQCNSDPLAIWLVQRHHLPPDPADSHHHNQLLRRLQQADQSC